MSVFKMQLTNTIDEEDQNQLVQFTGTIVFPLDIAPTREAAITMKNVVLRPGSINFDLDLSNFTQKQLRDNRLKIVLGTKTTLGTLNNEEFPDTLTEGAREVLLSTATKENVFAAKKEIKNLSINFNSGDFLDGPIKIFVTLVISSRVGIVNFFSINRGDIVFEEGLTLSSNLPEVSFLKKYDLTSLLREKTFTSDLHFSYSDDGVFSGFYALDAQKFVNEFTKFPNLIEIDDDVAFSQFLLRTECQLYKYNKQDYGSKIEEISGVSMSEKIENIVVAGSSGKLFYNFIIPSISNLAEYKFKLIFTFNDTTVDLMKDLIVEMQNLSLTNERDLVQQLALRAFSGNMPSKFINRINQINIISNVSFRDLVNEIINELNNLVTTAQGKTIANQNIKSQYMHPHPNIPTATLMTYEQDFQRVVDLKQIKQNNLVSFVGKNFFRETFATSITNLQNVGEVIEPASKTFAKTFELVPIKSFSILNILDQSAKIDNLTNLIDCGKSDDVKDEKISIKEPPSSVVLTTIDTKKIELLYLESIGNSASALIFKKLDTGFLSSIDNGTKVLVKLGVPGEFFDSYFYIIGNNFEA